MKYLSDLPPHIYKQIYSHLLILEINDERKVQLHIQPICDSTDGIIWNYNTKHPFPLSSLGNWRIKSYWNKHHIYSYYYNC
jgi:hypothetical protein